MITPTPPDHEYWDRSVESDEHLFGAQELKSRFYVLGGIAMACLAALFAGIIVLVQRAWVVPEIVAHVNGLFVAGTAKPFLIQNIDWKRDCKQQFEDTLEVFFLRTEKGPLPELSDFVMPGMVEELTRALPAPDGKTTPFVQTFKVLESRFPPAPAGIFRIHCQGVLASRGLKGDQSSNIFVEADFQPGSPSNLNTIGLKLASIKRLNEDEYFSEERERERLHRMRLDGNEKTK